MRAFRAPAQAAGSACSPRLRSSASGAGGRPRNASIGRLGIAAAAGRIDEIMQPPRDAGIENVAGLLNASKPSASRTSDQR